MAAGGVTALEKLLRGVGVQNSFDAQKIQLEEKKNVIMRAHLG